MDNVWGNFVYSFLFFYFYRQKGNSRNVYRDEEEVNFINHKIFQYVIKENMHHRFPIFKKNILFIPKYNTISIEHISIFSHQ